MSMKALDPYPKPYEIVMPPVQSRPVIVASPHSGHHYPPEFLAASRLDAKSLRSSEDCFVHEIFGHVPHYGVPLLHALFARAYIDANREPFELDQSMFVDELPRYVNRNSSRVAAGLGTIARVVADGVAIYRDKLRVDDAMARIESLYRPYHAALIRLIHQTSAHYGTCLLIDAHSMPSTSAGRTVGRRVDIVLGDRMGTSCAARFTAAAEAHLKQMGYRVMRNTPYAGGFTTGHYADPDQGRHCLQIEINRALYMDERRLEPKPFMRTVQEDMTRLVVALGDLAVDLRAAEIAARSDRSF